MAAKRESGMSAGQVVLVTFGFLLASFLVFIFGMWVGKDIAERRLAQEERVFRAPMNRPTPAPAGVQQLGPAGIEPLVPAGTPSPPQRFQLPGEVRPPTPEMARPTATPA